MVWYKCSGQASSCRGVLKAQQAIKEGGKCSQLLLEGIKLCCSLMCESGHVYG